MGECTTYRGSFFKTAGVEAVKVLLIFLGRHLGVFDDLIDFWINLLTVTMMLR